MKYTKKGINPYELRVGNYISHVLHEMVMVTGLKQTPVADCDLMQIFCKEEGWLLAEHCTPIPLSPEIMGKD